MQGVLVYSGTPGAEGVSGHTARVSVALAGEVIWRDGLVKSLTGGPLCKCFSGAGEGLGKAEGNAGQNSLLTSISCRWGARGSRGGAEGRLAC